MAKAIGSAKSGGRTKGVQNKSTAELRSIINEIISSKIDKAPEWIDRVAIKNPAKALEILIQLTDRVLPKIVATPEAEEQKEDFYAKEAKRLMSVSKAG